jgi:FkbM family methyltransferase
MSIIRKFKVLINSRKLFRNWLSAGIKYYLVKYGLLKSNITVKCCDGKFVLSPRAYSFIISAYNDGVLKSISCTNGLAGRLWGVVDFMVSNDGEALLKMPDGVLLSLESYDSTVLAETWLYEIHFLGFDLSDWLVIDIGAYIGDTALYYARRGAFVIAVEPLPKNYETMLKNLELNPGLKHRVLPINAAVSGEDGITEITYSASVDGGASIYGGGRFSTKVRSMRLSTLIKEIGNRGIDLGKFKVRVLKMDCKGCEYDVIHEVNTLKLFDIIKIEYSGYLRGKTYHELKEVLEDLGFKCRVWAHNEYALKIGLDKHGILTCVKECKEMMR